MMRLCSLPPWSIFVDQNIAIHAIYLTLGELGIGQDTALTPDQMAVTRTSEIESAARSIGFTLSLLGYPDMHLPFIPMQELVADATKIIRSIHTRAIFSFQPHETTLQFDHPDHNRAGLVAQHVAAAADVRYFYPQSTALHRRPELYYWTTNRQQANKQVVIPPAVASRRNNYLAKHHSSQFSNANRPEWENIFSKITLQPTGQHSEMYQKIR